MKNQKNDRQGRIWYLMENGYAAEDFWTHGMWPSAAKGKDPAWCNGSAPGRSWDPAAMAGLEFSLPYYLSFSIDRANASAPTSFWRHQWEKHGSCSGLGQRDYFLAVYAASAGLSLQVKLLPFGVTFNNRKGHPYEYLRKSIEAAVGVPGALPARGAMECALAPGSSRVVLATVTVCLDKVSLLPAECAAGATGAEQEEPGEGGGGGGPTPSSDYTPTSLDDQETMAQLLSNAAARFDCSKAPNGSEIFLPALLNGNASSDQGWITAKGSAWFLFAAFAALVPLLALAWLAARVAGRRHVRRPSREIAIGGGYGKKDKKKKVAFSSSWFSTFAERWLLPPRVVSNPSVAEDRVDVLEHPLSLSQLEKASSSSSSGGGKGLARALRALPVGAGITGEAARRVARLAFPVPDNFSSPSSSSSSSSSEPSAARLVLFLPGDATEEEIEAAAAATADVSAALCCDDDEENDREGGSAAGGGGGIAARGATFLRCGGSSSSPSSALGWIATRPLTFDELVVCRVSADDENGDAGLVLLSTPAGLEDARARRARPAAHGPRGWEIGQGEEASGGEKRPTPQIVASRLAVACALAASLSGDAASPPQLDAATWSHWARRTLSKATLFRLLLPFHADSRAYLAALDAAASLGLVSRKDVRDCGGPNALWGVLIDEMNEVAARGGRRFALDGLDLDSVDADVEGDADRAEARAARRGGSGPFRAVRSRAMAPVVRGPAWLEGAAAEDAGGDDAKGGGFGGGGRAAAFFDAAAAAEAAAQRASLALALRGGSRADAAADAAPKPPPPPQPQQQPQQQQQVPSLSLGRRLSRRLSSSSSVPEGTAAVAATAAAARAGEGSAFASAASAAPSIDADAASVAATAAGRSRAAARLAAASSVVQVVENSVVAAAKGGGEPPSALHPAAAGASAPAPAPASTAANNNSSSKDAAPASFYTPAEPEAGVLDADDAPERERVPLPRLAQFLAGVAALSPGFLAAAYACLLASVVAQLLVPLAFAMGFQALATGDGGGLALAAAQAAGLSAAAVACKLVGGVLLECFARRALRGTYAGLFDHLLFQEASFLERLAPGELMVRTSGGSATLRSLVTTVAFSATEGILLFLGAVVFLLTSSTGLAAAGSGGSGGEGGKNEERGVLLAVALAVALAAAEALVAGGFLWRQNLAVRRALGAVLGFSTDLLSSPAAVLSLERGPARAAADARLFLRDYAAAARTQGIARATHASLASAITAALRLSLLWGGARALFRGSAQLSDVYALFATTNWMETGLLLFADAYATAMADVGSLERLVELHDRGAVDPRRGESGRRGRGWRQRKKGPGGGKGSSGFGDSGASPLSPSISPVGPPTRFDLDGMGSGNNSIGTSQRLTGGFALRGVKVARPGGSGGTKLFLRGASTPKISSGRVLLVSEGGGASSAGSSESAGVSGSSSSLSGEGSALVDVLCLRLMPFKGVVEFEVEEGEKEKGEEEAGGEEGRNPFVAFDWLSGDKRAVRRALGVVALNSAALFPTTLAENVALGSSSRLDDAAGANAEAVRASPAFVEACAAAGVDELAAALPRGMDTVLSSSANLPSGAALRVAVARALLREPALLVVDDADAVAAALGEGSSSSSSGGGGKSGSGGNGGAARLGVAIARVLARGGTAVVVGSASVARARSLGLDASLCEEVELRDGVLIARK